MTVAVRAGPLRHPGTIMRATETRTTSGAVERAWAAIAHVRFSIEPMTLRLQERLTGGELQQEITHIVRMRYHYGVRTKDRLSWLDRGSERTLEIASIADVMERNRMFELLCKEVT